DVNTRAWDSSAIAQNGGTVIAGNNASTLGFMDDNYYHVRDSTGAPDMFITPTIDDGIVIADTDFLKHIEIQYNFRIKINAEGVGLIPNKMMCHFEILKDTEWLPIHSVHATRLLGSHTTSWQIGVPSDDYIGGNDNEKIITDTDIELRKFFNKDNGNYSVLKGLRFKLTGSKPKAGYFEIHVDYIKVKVGYDTNDVSPIMESITDSGGSTVICGDVPAWDKTGVVENDGFKIGQNTRAVLQDIASESGVDIGIIGEGDETTGICRPDGDVTTEWAHTGHPPNYWTEIDDDVEQPDTGDHGASL
ncbi:unnamed protein product, partial [marine sediment metagenome]